MSEQLPITCEGCGVCCMHMAVPPYEDEELDLLKESWPEVYADFMAARATRTVQLAVTGVELVPCAFFDMITRRCRHYDARPDICARFEVGGEFCRQQRLEARIDDA